MAFESDAEVARAHFHGLPGLGSMADEASSQTPEVLLRALGLYVDYAVANGERDALVALYRSVFDNGYVISGALARTLELLPRHRCRHLGGSTLDGARRSCL